MRQRVVGMRQSDIHILEHLFNDGRELIDSPADIAANIDFAPATVRERMPILRRVGLIQYYDTSNGQYELDGLGRQYVTGNLSQRDIDGLERCLARF